MKVINFGSINIDKVYRVNHFVQPGETIQSDYLDINPGGKGLNQSIAICRAGQEVFHAGVYGTEGEFLKEYLQINKVKTKYLKKGEANQGHAIIQVDDSGENSILLYKGSNGALDKEYIDEVFKDIHAGDFIVIQNEINLLAYIVKKARESDCKIIFNPAPMNANALAIDLHDIDWLIVNEIEGQTLSGHNDGSDILESLTQSYPKLNIILTLGARGSICLSTGKTYYQKAIPTKVCDTTGAGDTFIGYFVAGLLSNLSIKENLKKASVASSLCIEKEGAAPAIPYQKEVNAKLKQGDICK